MTSCSTCLVRSFSAAGDPVDQVGDAGALIISSLAVYWALDLFLLHLDSWLATPNDLFQARYEHIAAAPLFAEFTA